MDSKFVLCILAFCVFTFVNVSQCTLPFLDLQFDLKLNRAPKECRKRDHRRVISRCNLSYSISLLESNGDYDLQAVMLQEGHVPQLPSESKKHFRENTIVSIPAAVSRNIGDSHLYVGIKFYGLASNVQDYFIIDATKLLRLYTTKNVVSFDTDDLVFIAILKRGRASQNIAGRLERCGCEGYTCGCCSHLDIPKIELNTTGCVNLTYLPNDYGISFTLSLDGYVVYNNTISARNPPPVCFGVPYLKDYASLCVKFYNLNVQDHSFSGCVLLEAELYHVRIAEHDMGCFHLGPLVI